MLDTRFPRLPGDVGCAESFDPPALIERVAGARVGDAVTDQAHDERIINGFVDAARRLQDRGADIIATSCGFLSPLQPALEAAVSVPVVSSVLIDLADIRRALPASSAIGVLTYDGRKLNARHLPDRYGPYRIAGLEHGDELHRVISHDIGHLDRSAAERDALTSAKRLICQYPEVSILVLECTNLPPYQSRIEELTGKTVYSIQNAISARIRTLVDPTFGG